MGESYITDARRALLEQRERQRATVELITTTMGIDAPTFAAERVMYPAEAERAMRDQADIALAQHAETIAGLRTATAARSAYTLLNDMQGFVYFDAVSAVIQAFDHDRVRLPTVGAPASAPFLEFIVLATAADQCAEWADGNA